MSEGVDFASYVAARWPALVRSLVLLGLSPGEADAVATEGLARCASGFETARREGDVDVWVYRAVLAARLGHPPSTEEHPGVVDPTITDLEDRAERLAALRAELDLMTETVREALVLRHVAELDPAQVSDVLGVGPDIVDRAELTGPSAADLRHAVGAVPVRPAPVEAVAARVRARRRRRTRWTVGALAGVLLVTGVATWVTTRTDEVDLPEPEVVSVANPAVLPWYANGVLHLSRVTVELPQISQMVEVPDGVVYTDREGRVVLVDQQGRLSALGRTDPGEPIAAWTERGWVAWVETGDGGGELVVHDTLAGVEVARRPAEAGLRVVAVDQERVYYNLDGDPWSWRAPDEEPGREPGDALLDVASAVRVSEFSEASVLVTQPLFDIEVTMTGEEPVLSPDGDYLMARVSFDQPDELRVYEAASGLLLDSHLKASEVAVAAAFGPGHTITYVVGVREHAPESGEFVRLSETGPRLLRTCDIDLGTCESVAQFSSDRGTPVLPDR